MSKRKEREVATRYFLMSYDYTTEHAHGKGQLKREEPGGKFPNEKEMISILKPILLRQFGSNVNSIVFISIQELNESDFQDFVKQ